MRLRKIFNNENFPIYGIQIQNLCLFFPFVSLVRLLCRGTAFEMSGQSFQLPDDMVLGAVVGMYSHFANVSSHISVAYFVYTLFQTSNLIITVQISVS